MKLRTLLREASQDQVAVTIENAGKATEKAIAELSSRQSEIFTKSSKRLYEIRNALKTLKEEEETLKDEIKEKAEDLIPAEHKAATMVFKTASMMFTIAKASKAYTEEQFDAEGMIEELYNALPNLKDVLDEIKKAHTTMEKVEAKARALSNIKFTDPKSDVAKNFKDKVKLTAGQYSKEEPLNEDLKGLWDKFSSWISGMSKKIMNSLTGYENTLDDVEAKMNAQLASAKKSA